MPKAKTQDDASLKKRLDVLETERREGQDTAAGILAKAQSEGEGDEWRDLTADERNEVREAQSKAKAAQEQIDVIREQLGLSSTDDPNAVRIVKNAGGTDSANEDDSEEYRQLFDKYLRRGLGAMTDAEMEMIHEKRALSAGTDSEGGFTVPEGFFAQVTEAMKAFNWIDDPNSNVTRLNTATGNDIPMPTSNGTAEEGEIIDENTPANQEDPVFASVTMGAFLYTSKQVRISRVLTQDSGVDIEGLIARRLGERLGRIINRHTTVGNGTTQPQGFVTAAGIGHTAASTTALTYDDLIDLEHSVDPAYRNGAVFQTHDLTLATLRKLKDGDGRPLWQPSLISGVAPTINGRAYIVNQNMASTLAANADAMAFGNFSAYYYRTALTPVLLRIDDSLKQSFQYGFVMFSRHDGKLVDGGGGAIKKLRMAAS